MIYPVFVTRVNHIRQMNHVEIAKSCTVKPAHAVTSIKQSPVLKRHFFCPAIENGI